MANIKQAKQWLREGKRVRRPCWKEGSYWKLGVDESIYWGYDDIRATVHLNQLEANDWEICEEKKTLSDEIFTNRDGCSCVYSNKLRNAIKDLKNARLCGKISDEKINEIFGTKLTKD